MPEYVTTKMYTETRKALRLIAAQTGEQMVQVMDRLCADELKRLGLNVAESPNIVHQRQPAKKKEAPFEAS